jgi:hypothetical protein
MKLLISVTSIIISVLIIGFFGYQIGYSVGYNQRVQEMQQEFENEIKSNPAAWVIKMQSVSNQITSNRETKKQFYELGRNSGVLATVRAYNGEIPLDSKSIYALADKISEIRAWLKRN